MVSRWSSVCPSVRPSVDRTFARPHVFSFVKTLYVNGLQNTVCKSKCHMSHMSRDTVFS